MNILSLARSRVQNVMTETAELPTYLKDKNKRQWHKELPIVSMVL